MQQKHTTVIKYLDVKWKAWLNTENEHSLFFFYTI